MAGKQAKVLSEAQIDQMMAWLSNTRYRTRNQLIFALSVRAGLRAIEIAYLRWRNVLTGNGELSGSIEIEDGGSKGRRGGRTIPMHPAVRELLAEYRLGFEECQPKARVIITERRPLGMTPASLTSIMWVWYKEAGYIGSSSHSGRRTFITNAARKIGKYGGSIRDVQYMAGHRNLNTTQLYIDADRDAMKRLIEDM